MLLGDDGAELTDHLLANAMTSAEPGYWLRVRQGLGWRGFCAVAGLSVLVSTQLLFQPHLFEMWELPDISVAWLLYYGETLSIGIVLWLAVVCAEQSRVAGPARGGVLALAMVVPVFGVLVALVTWRHGVAWLLESPWLLIGETMKFAFLGTFAYSMRALQRHAERANKQALDLEAQRQELDSQAAEAQLQLLQAQIEPHFLFNTLATVRRLYRRQPAAGAETIENLMVYLHAALQQARRSESTLGEEFDLVEAYFQLCQVRMGPRLNFVLDLPPVLRQLPFAPMVLVTLAENAIKHGLTPTELGGTVVVAARRDAAGGIEVSVTDDGVGFGASSGGTGVGLVNIRRQLAVRYGEDARLVLEEQPQGGVAARIVLPHVTLSLATAPHFQAAAA